VIWPMRRRFSFLQIKLGRELINNTGGAGLPEAALPSGSRAAMGARCGAVAAKEDARRTVLRHILRGLVDACGRPQFQFRLRLSPFSASNFNICSRSASFVNSLASLRYCVILFRLTKRSMGVSQGLSDTVVPCAFRANEATPMSDIGHFTRLRSARGVSVDERMSMR
jgi:hypothetical protein